jgi:hypothetical protein
LGGDFTLNVLNFSFLAGKENTAANRLLSSGLLELHLGKDGVSMNIGTGGVNASVQNLAQVGQGIAAYYDVNSKLAKSKQEETKEFASAMRTLYSGTDEQRGAFEDALENRLLLRKSGAADFEGEDGERTMAKTVDNGDGTRTMHIGRAALEEGSRFGLNVVFGHEAYRNGVDDGAEGQRLETDRAVEGHINTALALMSGYGAGSVGAGFAVEALEYSMARANNDAEGMRRVTGRYDSSADYWRLTADGGLEYDGDGWLRDANGEYILDNNGNRVGAAGIETGLINILALDPGKAEDVAKVQDMMTAAGLKHRVKEGGNPEDRNAWYWDGSVAEHNSTVTIGQNLLAPMGMVHLPAERYTGLEMLAADYLRAKAHSATTPENVQPGQPGPNDTYCNVVSKNTDDALLGAQMSSLFWGASELRANAMGERLASTRSSVEGWEAQDAANRGELAKVSYINPIPDKSGHIATVVASYGTYIPALGPKIAQGGGTNGVMWTQKGFGRVMSSSNYYVVASNEAVLRQLKALDPQIEIPRKTAAYY